MGLFQKIFKRHDTERTSSPDHAVLVVFPVSNTEFGESAEREEILRLEHELVKAIEREEAGEFDGDEFGEGECTLYMYGRDADRLFSAVETVLRNSPLTKPGRAVIRYGTPGAKQKQIELDSAA